MFLNRHDRSDSEKEDGLLDTDLTWAELQEDLQRTYGEKAQLGTKISIKDIADGKGYVARTGVVENIKESCSFGNIRVGGKSLIVSFRNENKKSLLPSSDSNKRSQHSTLLKQFHNTECLVFDKLSSLQLFPGPTAYITRPLKDKNLLGYILMDHYANSFNLIPYNYLEKKIVFKILNALARFNACSQHFSANEREQLEHRIVSDIFKPLVLDYDSTLLEASKKFLGKEYEHVVLSLDKASKFLMKPQIIEKLDHIDSLLGMEKVLCHGDPWLGNFLFRKENGSIKVDGLLDFQTAHFGCIGHDLSRLFCYVLPPEERHQNIGQYIAFYYNSLRKHWPEDVSLPFTEDQVHKACDRYLPLTTFVVSILVAARGKERCDQSKDPKTTKQFLLKKISALVDDMNQSIDDN